MRILQYFNICNYVKERCKIEKNYVFIFLLVLFLHFVYDCYFFYIYIFRTLLT